MRIDYASHVIVGYVVQVEDLFRKLLRRRDGLTHEEDRFDPRTGKQAAPATVVDVEAGWDVVVDGRAFEGPESKAVSSLWGWRWEPDGELLDVLAARVGCSVTLLGRAHDEIVFVCFQPTGLRRRKDGSVPLDSIAKHRGEVKRIGRAAKELRLRLGRPGVYAITEEA